LRAPIRAAGLLSWRLKPLQFIEESIHSRWFVAAALRSLMCHRLDATVKNPKYTKRPTREAIRFRLGAVFQE